MAVMMLIRIIIWCKCMYFPTVQIVTEFFGGRFEDKIVNSNFLAILHIELLVYILSKCGHFRRELIICTVSDA